MPVDETNTSTMCLFELCSTAAAFDGVFGKADWSGTGVRASDDDSLNSRGMHRQSMMGWQGEGWMQRDDEEKKRSVDG